MSNRHGHGHGYPKIVLGAMGTPVVVVSNGIGVQQLEKGVGHPNYVQVGRSYNITSTSARIYGRNAFPGHNMRTPAHARNGESSSILSSHGSLSNISKVEVP